MRFDFKLGVIATSFLLVNIHMFIFTLILVVAYGIEGLTFILSVVGIGYAAITVLGHIRASWVCMGQMHDPNVLGKPLEDLEENLEEEVNILRNPIILALTWRFKKEWEYIKKTANFDFKS